jgi:hypothetical protein
MLRVIRRAPRTLALLIAASAMLTGCSLAGAPAPTGSSTIGPTYGSLGAGFYDPSNPPAPEGTLTPPAGSWDEAHPPAGFTAVVIAYGTDAQTATLRDAVTSWAGAEHVALTTITPTSHDDLVPSLFRAIDAKPDVIITVGNTMVDPVAAVSAGYLAQDFLVVGGEIAEPTANVTAADWTGAGFRGEGLGSPAHFDAATFTPERAGRALRAGIGAIVNKVTGIVVWVD